MPEAEEKQKEDQEDQKEEPEEKNLWTLYSPLISGGWKCLSFNLFSKSHPPKLLAQPHGPTPLGRLYISPRGWLAVHLAAVPDRDVAIDKKKEDHGNVNGGLAMYCGYLKLYRRGGGGEDDGQEELYWRTVVEVSSDSNLIGGVQERKVVFEEMERKKKSDGDSGGGGGGGGGQEEEEEKSYYMILEPKQDWIMEVCNILEFLFFFLLSLPTAAGWLALVELDWIPFFPFLPPFFFSRLSFYLGKMGMIFFLTLNSRLSNSPTNQPKNSPLRNTIGRNKNKSDSQVGEV